MRIFISLCIILLLQTWSPYARASVSAPDRFDWSIRQAIFQPESSDQHPHVIQDAHGIFHIAELNSHDEFQYIRFTPQGEIVANNTIQLELQEDSVYTSTISPEGIQIVWTIPDDRLVNLFFTTLDTGGEEATVLDYELPETPWITSRSKITSINANYDSTGKLHLSLTVEDSRNKGIFYLRFNQEMEQEFVHSLSTSPPIHTGGQMVIDSENTVYILTTTRTNQVNLTQVKSNDSVFVLTNIASSIWSLGGDSQNVYARRSVPPSMAIDSNDVIHLASNHVTQPPGLGPMIIDVMYTRIKDGEILSQEVFTPNLGQSHFPGLTVHNDQVFITWERSMGNSHELLYTAFSTSGEALMDHHRLTYERAPSRLGLVFGDNGHLSAMWWSFYQGETLLSFKSTHSPPPPSPWNALGFVTDDPNSTISGQLLFFTPMLLITALASFLTNIHVLIIIFGALLFLHKLKLLELIQQKKYALWVLTITTMYLLLPTPEASGAIDGGVWQLFSALTATLLLTLGMYLGKVKIGSSFNLVLSSMLWLYLVMFIQVLPGVPNQFTF